MGAGPEPLTDPHRRRPPIPIAPVDTRARDAALAGGASPTEAWLAAVTGSTAPPVRSGREEGENAVGA